MADWRLRLTLIVVGMHLSFFKIALSKNANFEKDMKSRRFSTNAEIAPMKRGEEVKSRSTETGDELKIHDRRRRALGCCAVTPSSCPSPPGYRTIDGTCNNFNNPCWGAADIPLVRFLTAAYEDGTSSPRGTGRNPSLPSARAVSAAMFGTSKNANDSITLMVMQFGQALDHDMTITLEDNATQCCDGSTHASCFPINVTGDPVYSSAGITCHPFVRSTATLCAPGTRREQINANTAYLDASHVYGSSQSELDAVRMTGSSHLLKFGPDKENSACLATDPDPSCRTFLPVRTNSMGNTEFFAGDRRVEEQPGLTSLHAIFLRLHNHLATVIKNNNPTCSDETVFQETRLIVGSLMQKITYDEFLPIVLGQNTMNSFRLPLRNFSGWEDFTNPSIANGFSTASFRFGHSLIKDNLTTPSTTVRLCDSFNNHARTTVAGTFPSHFMRGICTDPSEPMDQILVDAVHNRLFASPGCSIGQDLYARNIQRGRDHGIPNYLAWRNACGLSTPTTVSGLSQIMPNDVATQLGNLYAFAEDIDLFPAAIAEFNQANSLLGPTFACINAQQFSNLKFGDRYWFENGIFNSNELNSIYNTTLSSLICKYTDETQLQKFVMLPQSVSNPVQNCSTLTSVGVVNDIGTIWTNLCPPITG